MTTHRRYTFQDPGERSEGHEAVLQVLEKACARDWWYHDPEVSGQPFNRLAFSFTVRARDRWWAHRRAMRLAVDCYYALGLGERHVPMPEWVSLTPHTNRGRWRTPTAS